MQHDVFLMSYCYFYLIILFFLSMKTLSLLVITLLHIHLTEELITTPPAPFSYTESLEFASYQFSPQPGIFLSNIFTISLTFDNAFSTKAQTAILLGGFQNRYSSRIEFTVTQDSANSDLTSASLIVFFSGTTNLTYISFFYVVISSNTYFTFITNTPTLFPSTGSPGVFGTVVESSPHQTFTNPLQGIAGSQYYFFIQSFQIDCLSASFCEVTINDYTSSSTATDFQYSIATDSSNTLTGVVFVIICARSINAPYYSYGFQTLDFAALINKVYADTNGNGFQNYFNGKCLFGQKSFTFDTSTFNLIYDMTKSYATINSTLYFTNVSTYNINLTMFCFLEKIDCSILDPYCITCTSLKTCIDCAPAYYVDAKLCKICSSVMPGCTACENSTICLGCNTPTYYFDTANAICQDCITYLVQCQNCTDTTACIQCRPGYGLSDPTTCLACGIMTTYCSLCMNLTYCYQCLSGYYVQYSGNTCQPCSIISNCLLCANASFCLSCIESFIITPDHSHCVCSQGLYPINGFCSVLGCISAYKFTSTVCLACDTAKQFRLINGVCVCSTGFTLSGTTCVQICGDGIVIYGACDDGNLRNGDGCSDQCTVQSNYKCINGSITSLSKCVYKTPLDLILTDVVKTLEINQFQITMMVSDKSAPIDEMNISNYMKILIGNTLFTDFSITYDLKTGILNVFVNYNYTIEGLPIVLTLGYDPTLFDLGVSSLNFDAKGENMALLSYSQSTGHETIIDILNYVVVVISLVMLVTSALFHKIIGAETFQVTQIVFFTRFLMDEGNSQLFQSLSSLKYINFYNFFSPYVNIRSLQGPLLRMGLTRVFVFNLIIQLGLIALVWILYSIFERKHQMYKKSNTNDNVALLNLLKKYKYLSYIFSNYIFIFTLTSFYLMIFSYFSSLQQNQELAYTLPNEFIVLNILIFSYFSLYLCKELYGNFIDAKKYNEEEGSYYRYLTIFLLYSILVTLLTIGGAVSSNGKFVFGALEILYLTFLIVYRPYLINMHNASLILNQITVVIFTVLMIMNDYFPFLKDYRGFIAIGINLLLVLINVLGFIRLAIHFRYNSKAFQKMKFEAENPNGSNEKQDFSLKQLQKNKKMTNNLPRSKKTAQKQMQEKQRENDALIRLKNRLMHEYQQKVQFEQSLLEKEEK